VLADAGDCAGLVLPIDLPLASPAALGRVVGDPHDVVIVPDESRDGTNILRLAPPVFRGFGFAYGTGSYARHRAAARRAGFVAHTVREPSLMFDVDGPAQYQRWAPLDSLWTDGRG
jgi:2-phospho-L-lactate guanylyltransferase (CobY/MobA/RfbA family)